MSDVIQLQEILGYAPSGYLPDYFMKNAYPIVEFIPCTPSFQSGSLQVFRLNPTNEYKDLLKKHGYVLGGSQPSRGSVVKMAVVADAFPTDTFTNEYSESFLENVANTASSGMSAIAQMFGERNLSGIGGEIGNIMGNMLPDFFTNIGSKVKSKLNDVNDAVKKSNNTKLQGMLSTAKNIIDQTMAGARLDFPLVWGNSNFTPSYTFTVRLYNPYPSDLNMTKKYIIGPLAAILLLGLPIGGGGVYNWPYFSRISVPGLWSLPNAAISNITVIKGGDQQQIAWNNRMGICDVRVDVISLYGSIVADTSGGGDESGRPTLRTYLSNLEGERTIEKRIHEDPDLVQSSGASSANTSRNTNNVGITTTSGTVEQTTSRISNSDKDAFDALNNLPSF